MRIELISPAPQTSVLTLAPTPPYILLNTPPPYPLLYLLARRDLNPRLPAYKADALTAELQANFKLNTLYSLLNNAREGLQPSPLALIAPLLCQIKLPRVERSFQFCITKKARLSVAGLAKSIDKRTLSSISFPGLYPMDKFLFKMIPRTRFYSFIFFTIHFYHRPLKLYHKKSPDPLRSGLSTLFIV